MNKLRKWLLQTGGFTLLEAIISVAIVGMVIVPISMVFNGTLQQTIVAKHQLKANQLAQLYVENIKAKPEVELINFFAGANSKVITSAVNGFPAVPSGYSVELQYNKGLPLYAGFEVKNSTGPRPDVDFEINFLSANDRKMAMVYKQGTDTLDYTFPTHRIIEVSYNLDNTIDIRDKTSASTPLRTIKPDELFSPITGPPKFYYAFSLNCPAVDVQTTSIDTKVIIVNKTDMPITCYVYQTELNTIKPTITSTEGPIIIENNLNTVAAGSADYKIYSVKVIVRDANNIILTSLDATKVDE